MEQRLLELERQLAVQNAKDSVGEHLRVSFKQCYGWIHRNPSCITFYVSYDIFSFAKAPFLEYKHFVRAKSALECVQQMISHVWISAYYCSVGWYTYEMAGYMYACINVSYDETWLKSLNCNRDACANNAFVSAQTTSSCLRKQRHRVCANNAIVSAQTTAILSARASLFRPESPTVGCICDLACRVVDIAILRPVLMMQVSDWFWTRLSDLFCIKKLI